MRRLRIAIATTGRFHVLDLARELSLLGHDVVFYSFVPKYRAVRFGLPAGSHRGLLPFVAPYFLVQRLFPRRGSEFADRNLLRSMDTLIASRLEPCDVFIGMSGLCVESAREAKRKHGAVVFIERGSRHILSQKEILESMPGRRRESSAVPAHAVERELEGYGIADMITVPSKHVERSFLERGFPAGKMFRNPYGVDLRMFHQTPAPPRDPPTILFVGSWSYRKGCDILVEAWRMLKDVRLVHVGAIGDAPLPGDSNFLHFKPVPQWDLNRYYGMAHVFVLASREEGLSLVQLQALACGLPVVCTDRTGGEDIREMISDPTPVSVVPAGQSPPLAEAIRSALQIVRDGSRNRDYLGDSREMLSWRNYGERYHRKMEEVTSTLFSNN